MASGKRLRAWSAAKSIPNANSWPGDPAPSASTAAHTSSAARDFVLGTAQFVGKRTVEINRATAALGWFAVAMS
jgi:hypothetical protein